MPTLKDIAQKVGVSISTVSRVLSNEANRSINTQTKQDIWDTAREIGYAVKEPSKEPHTETRNIGCLVSTLQNKHYHPYFSVIIDGIEKELQRKGYNLVYTHTHGDLENPQILQKAIHHSQVEGIIVIEGIDSKIYNYIKKNVSCIVGIDIADQTVPTISYDRVEAARTSVNHLIEQGHRDIMFIGGTGLSGDFEKEKRYRGYRLALEQAGIKPNPLRALNAQWDPDNCYEMMGKYLEQHKDNLPTAIFTASDLMAMAAMRAISENGYRIPQDFAIIGFDDNEASRFTVPPLSTVQIPTFEIGIIAAKTMISCLNDPYPLPIKITVPFQTQFRQSTDYRIEEQK
ncbi:MAG: LacI family transcriptional regulator [Bacilli bacterium]|nr:LacI family transcriptional regulator [Bacilli bacterium]